MESLETRSDVSSEAPRPRSSWHGDHLGPLSRYADTHRVLLHQVGQTHTEELVEERDEGPFPEEGWPLQPARHCVICGQTTEVCGPQQQSPDWLDKEGPTSQVLLM